MLQLKFGAPGLSQPTLGVGLIKLPFGKGF